MKEIIASKPVDAITLEQVPKSGIIVYRTPISGKIMLFGYYTMIMSTSELTVKTENLYAFRLMEFDFHSSQGYAFVSGSAAQTLAAAKEGKKRLYYFDNVQDFIKNAHLIEKSIS